MKKLISFFNKIKVYIRQNYFPTEQDKSIKKWRADNGDYNLIPVHELDENSLVMDIGGFHGDFSAEIYARYSCRIKVFEPVPHFVEQMRKRFKKNRKIEIYEIGLGGHASTESMSVNQYSSSVHRNVGKDSINIKIEDIVDWLDANNIEKVSLMKINIEGSEYELLERLINSKYIHSTNEIQVQFHDFFPDAKEKMTKIQDKLSKTHELTYQYPFIWENWKLKQ
ncbi:MAG: FkbM family methyltransferase [Prevotella sp.]|nr:FkbM family methyltransferase [Prevotella sp.]